MMTKANTTLLLTDPFTNQLGFSNSFSLDEAGSKLGETNANGEITAFTYNSAGDLLTLKDGKTNTTTWVYDEYAGQRTKSMPQESPTFSINMTPTTA